MWWSICSGRGREDRPARLTLRAGPTISTCFGIAIRMYHNDHLPPHFHAEYQGQASQFGFSGEHIRPLEVFRDSDPLTDTRWTSARGPTWVSGTSGAYGKLTAGALTQWAVHSQLRVLDG